jgi:inosine-uridine nucleoside N-ribohydrolase
MIRLVFVVLLVMCSVAAASNNPVIVIFDTDMGNDVDDVVALAMLHALQSRGECRITAVTVSKDQELAGPFVDVINTFYGRSDIPIGVVRNGPTRDEGKYLSLVNRYPHRLNRGADAPDAVMLLRTVLAKEPDVSVVIIQTGFSTNLARLLESKADENSELTGTALIRKKVRLLSVMGGAFGPHASPEYNVTNDIAAAKKVFETWPTPVVFSGFEIGLAVEYPSQSILQDFRHVEHHPLVEAYVLYNPPPHNRPCWDPTAALFAVRPDRGYFGLSAPGRVTVAANGATHFEPLANGNRRYLTIDHDQVIRAREAIVELASQPPQKSTTPAD